VPAVNTAVPALGFMNIATRNIFRGHLELWERIAREKRPYLVLEDDASFPPWVLPHMQWFYARVQRLEWSCLYFYSSTTWNLQRVTSGSTHAYILNPARALGCARHLRDAYDRIARLGRKDWTTHVDQCLRREVWTRPECVCWGTPELVFRVDMGSDTGWGAPGTKLRIEP
jgi:hypothetical protein